MRTENVTRRTWLGDTLVVVAAVFVGGKCQDIEVNDYDTSNLPPHEVRELLKRE